MVSILVRAGNPNPKRVKIYSPESAIRNLDLHKKFCNLLNYRAVLTPIFVEKTYLELKMW